MIFIDTGAFLERDRKGGDYGDLAELGFRKLFNVGGVTTDLVLEEVAS